MNKINSKERFYNDIEFLKSPDARPIRILSEYYGPQQRFSRNRIEDTIVFFGSARIKSPETAKEAISQAPKNISREKLKHLEHDLELSAYYKAARTLAFKLTKWSKGLKNKQHRYIITSGGGPGIMEAANRGTSDAKGLAIGLNITIPTEQSGNQWITPDLNMRFHYFFMRKFWMAYLAKALIVFPGGFGTLDELMEILTLIQTKKIRKTIPIVLYGKEFWNQVVNWEYLIDFGTISRDDFKLFQFCDTVEDAYKYLTETLRDIQKGPNF